MKRASFRKPGPADAAWSRAEWARTPSWPRTVWIARAGFCLAVIATLVWMAGSAPTRVASTASITRAEPPPSEIAMRAPVMTGRLKDGRAYAISARSAVAAGDGEQTMALGDVQARIDMADGRTLEVQAAQGRIDRDRAHVLLTGGVEARRSDGYRLSTESAELWDTEAGVAGKSDQPVDITGPRGTAGGSGMTIAPGLDPVRLRGPVTIRTKGAAG